MRAGPGTSLVGIGQAAAASSLAAEAVTSFAMSQGLCIVIYRLESTAMEKQ